MAMGNYTPFSSMGYYGRYGMGGGGGLSGLLGSIGEAMLESRAQNEMQTLQNQVGQQLQELTQQGMDPRKALLTVLTKNPQLLFQLPSEHFQNAASLLNALRPTKNLTVIPPGGTAVDESGNVVATGGPRPLPPEIQMALAGSGWNGQGEPTPEQWAGARGLLKEHLAHAPNDTQTLFNAAADPNNPNHATALAILNKRGSTEGTPSLLKKLQDEQDAIGQQYKQALDAGDTASAQRLQQRYNAYNTAIEAAQKDPFGMLQYEAQRAQAGQAPLPLPVQNPTPAPAQLPTSAATAPASPSAAPQSQNPAFDQYLISKAQQALATGKPVQMVDPVRGSMWMTPAQAKAIIGGGAAAATGHPVAPAPSPVPLAR